MSIPSVNVAQLVRLCNSPFDSPTAPDVFIGCGEDNWAHLRYEEIRPPSYYSEGLRRRHCVCNRCQRREHKDDTISRLTRSSECSSHHHHRSSSDGGNSSSSVGGGGGYSSGGGGGGASW